MNTYISLNRNIDCNYICGEINKLLSRFAQQNGKTNDAIICVSIRQPKDNAPEIPLLEIKPEQ